MPDRKDIIEKVRLCLDEVSTLSEGTTIADPQIEGQLDDSAVSLLKLLPSILCPITTPSPLPEVDNDIITCPSDFIKLSEVKLDTWYNSVEIPLPIAHPRTRMESYQFLAAMPSNPLVAIKKKEDGFYLYVRPEGSIEVFNYVKRPEKAEDLTEEVWDMLAWHAAERIYAAHGEERGAALCKGRLEELIKTSLLM